MKNEIKKTGLFKVTFNSEAYYHPYLFTYLEKNGVNIDELEEKNSFTIYSKVEKENIIELCSTLKGVFPRFTKLPIRKRENTISVAPGAKKFLRSKLIEFING
jgi:hypothetical protein